VADVTTAQFLVAFLVAATAGTAVFFHAERHRVPHPSAWASFVFLFLIAGLPSYLIRVRRLRKKRARPS
jgi:Flp pilus assembly protein TadB